MEKKKKLCDYICFTDGAYSRIRDQGGVGIVMLRDGVKVVEFSKAYKETTNNKMELMAVIIPLLSIKKEINSMTIITDSQYVIGCATLGWKRKKNQALWREFDEAFNKAKSLCPNIKFEWTKGHADNEFNNLADRLANKASQEYIQ